MIQDIQRIFNEKGIDISKWEWIKCQIHKMEVKCGYISQKQNLVQKPPHSVYQKSYCAPVIDAQEKIPTYKAPEQLPNVTLKPIRMNVFLFTFSISRINVALLDYTCLCRL